jgi:predicted GIY-YIG superfamily endonuclease
MNKSYKIYGLINPKTNKICYIGYTTQTLKRRLQQHLNPILENKSKIAKLSRSLKRQDLKLTIVEICQCIDVNDMYEKEIYYRDWRCDPNAKHENSFGFGIFPKGNTKVRVKIEDFCTGVENSNKARVWGFEILTD